jgi:hypothetical protein
MKTKLEQSVKIRRDIGCSPWLAFKPNQIKALLFVCFGISTVINSGCSRQEVNTFIPQIPPSYYSCIECQPRSLINALDKESLTGANRYAGQIFIFKKIPVTSAILHNIGQGYIWVNEIKCYLLSTTDFINLGLREGDTIDVVGVNKGFEIQEIPRCVVLRDCVVFKSGSIQLPIDYGGSGPEVSII